MSNVIATTQLLPVSLPELVQRIIKDNKRMEEIQIKEYNDAKSNNQGDFAQIIARHINQTSANRCLYATQILMNIENMLQQALKTGDSKRLEQCVSVVCDQLHLYKTNVVDSKGLV